MDVIIVTTKSELTKIVNDCMMEALKKYNLTLKETGNHLFTINQIAKRLHKSHATIKKLVHTGYIKTTSSGLISEEAINDYLQGN